MTAPSDGSAVKPAPVDIEAGKARLGLRPGAPIGARRIDHVQIAVRNLDDSAGSMPPFWASSSRRRLRAGASSEPPTAFTCVSSRILPQGTSSLGMSISIMSDLSSTTLMKQSAAFTRSGFGSVLMTRSLTGHAAGLPTSWTRTEFGSRSRTDSAAGSDDRLVAFPLLLS